MSYNLDISIICIGLGFLFNSNKFKDNVFYY
jgi:hypothetical protein